MAAYERMRQTRGQPYGGPSRGVVPPGYALPRQRRQEVEEEEEETVGDSGFSSSKTVLVLCIVAGCFAVLWPKIFVPMLFGDQPGPVKTDDDAVLGGRQERPVAHPAGEAFMNPAMAERGRMGAHPGEIPVPGENGMPIPGRPINGAKMPPMRTIDKEWAGRGGPMPGMRPTIGGPGMQPNQPKGGGTMGVIMPIYTIGIIIFFLYTTMKIMFKNKNEEEEEEEDPNASYNKKFYGDDKNKYDEEYYNNYIKQYQAAQNKVLPGGVEAPITNPGGARVEDLQEEPEQILLSEELLEGSTSTSIDGDEEETEESIEEEDNCSPSDQTPEPVKEVIPEAPKKKVAAKKGFRMHPAAAAAARAAAATEGPGFIRSTPDEKTAPPPASSTKVPAEEVPSPHPPAETPPKTPTEKAAQDIADRLSGFWGPKKEVVDPRDVEISLLKARLEETEKAMERIVAQMGAVTARLAPHILSQAMDDVNTQQHQCQAPKQPVPEEQGEED